MPISVKEIIEKHLRENEFDGLCYAQEGATCGCGLDDLAPCGDYCWDCEPGFAGPPPFEYEGYTFYYPTREAADKAKAEAEKEQGDA